MTRLEEERLEVNLLNQAVQKPRDFHIEIVAELPFNVRS
jgi:hypothetical protein